MATTIGITTGALTAGRTYQDDEAAQAILIRFAAHINAQGTHQQQLQAVVDYLVAHIQAGARDYQISTERAAMIANAEEENRLT